MAVFSSVNRFLTWLWSCIHAWIEIGRRMRELEEGLKGQVEAARAEDERLRVSIASVIASQEAGRECLYRRIDELDRAQQKRIDEWALQLSGQINQLYAAAAKALVSVRDR